jgi:hypothetical protein
MKSRILTAMPAFIATYGGITAYLAVKGGNSEVALVVLAVLIVIGIAGLWVGQRIVGRWVVAGTALIALWILTLIAVGAVLTAAFFWVGLRLPDWLSPEEISDEAKDLSKVLLGAATAFAAVVFTDDLDKGEGDLWPSTKTRRAYSRTFSEKFENTSAAYDAAFEDRVRPRQSEGVREVVGWGLVARFYRAAIIERGK